MSGLGVLASYLHIVISRISALFLMDEGFLNIPYPARDEGFLKIPFSDTADREGCAVEELLENP